MFVVLLSFCLISECIIITIFDNVGYCWADGNGNSNPTVTVFIFTFENQSDSVGCVSECHPARHVYFIFFFKYRCAFLLAETRSRVEEEYTGLPEKWTMLIAGPNSHGRLDAIHMGIPHFMRGTLSTCEQKARAPLLEIRFVFSIFEKQKCGSEESHGPSVGHASRNIYVNHTRFRLVIVASPIVNLNTLISNSNHLFVSFQSCQKNCTRKRILVERVFYNFGRCSTLKVCRSLHPKTYKKNEMHKEGQRKRERENEEKRWIAGLNENEDAAKLDSSGRESAWALSRWGIYSHSIRLMDQRKQMKWKMRWKNNKIKHAGARWYETYFLHVYIRFAFAWWRELKNKNENIRSMGVSGFERWWLSFDYRPDILIVSFLLLSLLYIGATKEHSFSASGFRNLFGRKPGLWNVDPLFHLHPLNVK